DSPGTDRGTTRDIEKPASFAENGNSRSGINSITCRQDVCIRLRRTHCCGKDTEVASTARKIETTYRHRPCCQRPPPHHPPRSISARSARPRPPTSGEFWLPIFPGPSQSGCRLAKSARKRSNTKGFRDRRQQLMRLLVWTVNRTVIYGQLLRYWR